jgi:hypothetical protein
MESVRDTVVGQKYQWFKTARRCASTRGIADASVTSGLQNHDPKSIVRFRTVKVKEIVSEEWTNIRSER